MGWRGRLPCGPRPSAPALCQACPAIDHRINTPQPLRSPSAPLYFYFFYFPCECVRCGWTEIAPTSCTAAVCHSASASRAACGQHGRAGKGATLWNGGWLATRHCRGTRHAAAALAVARMRPAPRRIFLGPLSASGAAGAASMSGYHGITCREGGRLVLLCRCSRAPAVCSHGFRRHGGGRAASAASVRARGFALTRRLSNVPPYHRSCPCPTELSEAQALVPAPQPSRGEGPPAARPRA